MADIAVLRADVALASMSNQCELLHEAFEVPPDQLHGPMPFELDLGDPRSIASLRAIDVVWPQISSEEKSRWLQNLRVTLPVRSITSGDVAVLPGGIIAVRHPDDVLVCDPLEPITLNEVETWQLRRAVSSRVGIASLLHVEDGVLLRPGIPDLLPPQSATVVSDATKLPGRASVSGPVLIQWFVTGATVWPLVPAPPSVALAATVAGIRLSDDAQPALPEFWDAGDAYSRMYLLSSGLVTYMTDLLPVDLSDDLRFAVVDLCVTGEDSLAGRLTEILAAVPACFLGDASAVPGEPPAAWSTGIALMRRARRPLAFFGLEANLEPRSAVATLRDVIGDHAAVIFHETGTGQRGVTAALDSDAALFAARWAAEGGRVGILLDPQSSPFGLYSLGARLAHATGGTVTMAAPCWGFCHRIARDHEAGNAAWFGMGAGLDELDLLVSDPVGVA